MNDNLATLGDIMLATKRKIDELENTVKATMDGVKEVDNTIQKIDGKNTPREITSFRLLVITAIVSIIGVTASIIALFK